MILATRRDLVGLETLLDQGGQRVPSLLSGQEHRQNREHLEVQASPRILSHLAVLWGLVVPEAPSDLGDPLDQGVLALL